MVNQIASVLSLAGFKKSQPVLCGMLNYPPFKNQQSKGTASNKGYELVPMCVAKLERLL